MGWQGWERDLQQDLGLSATICSGNQWHDQGDAVDNRPPDFPFRLMVDAKFTESLSYSLNAKRLKQWWDIATEKGKRGLLAVRFWPRGTRAPSDYVVLSLEDFIELYDKAYPRV